MDQLGQRCPRYDGHVGPNDARLRRVPCGSSVAHVDTMSATIGHVVESPTHARGQLWARPSAWFREKSAFTKRKRTQPNANLEPKILGPKWLLVCNVLVVVTNKKETDVL